MGYTYNLKLQLAYVVPVVTLLQVVVTFIETLIQ